MTMLSLYRFLLRLYPARTAAEFGDEMAGVLGELHRGRRTDVFAARVRFVLCEVSGLLSGALREQLHERNRNLSGGTMRTLRSFRFPRWTIVMMILIFCAVNTAIEKGRMASVLLSGRPAPASHWWTIPGVFLFVFALLASVGLIGYCVLHVFREARTGKGE
jgi:hypothetical protein